MALTLLVVEDHPSVRRLLELIAQDDGRFGPCLSAGTGPTALRLAQDHRPDVIVLDADLDGSDGLALIPALRAAAPDTSVVVFSSTAYAGPEIAVRAGADMFLAKGTDLDEVLDVLAALTSRSQTAPLPAATPTTDLCEQPNAPAHHA
jgi:CheY-like chemotaxis protein